MRFELLCVVALSLGTCFVIGCGEKSAPAPSKSPAAPAAATSDEAKFSAAIAKLPEEDREAATAQKFCVVEEKSRLGSMGMPFKVTVEGKPVFLCCRLRRRSPEGSREDAGESRRTQDGKMSRTKTASRRSRSASGRLP